MPSAPLAPGGARRRAQALERRENRACTARTRAPKAHAHARIGAALAHLSCAPGRLREMLAEGASMGAGQSPGSGGGEATKLTSSLRPPNEATIRLSVSDQERETLSRLRATLPPLEPISCEMPVLREPAPARETPPTIVLPAT